MSKKIKITAYLGIFEQRLTRLIKDIKKYKKSGNKDHAKRLLQEAKGIREVVRAAAEDRKNKT